MLSKIKKGKLVYRDQEENVMIGVFENKNVKKVKYGIISITVLRGQFKERLDFTVPDFHRFLQLVGRMPEIEKKQK